MSGEIINPQLRQLAESNDLSLHLACYQLIRKFRNQTYDVLMIMSIPGQFKNITTFIFDVDGVLTDGTVLVLENGLQARRMSIKDGYALQLAVKKRYRILVISGAASSPVVDRLKKLGITDVHTGITDKKNFIKNFIVNQNLTTDQVLFMGDDLPDLPAMSVVGLPVCPADAVTEIKEVSKYVSPLNGGYGCVRDVIEQVLKSRGNWEHTEDIASR